MSGFFLGTIPLFSLVLDSFLIHPLIQVLFRLLIAFIFLSSCLIFIKKTTKINILFTMKIGFLLFISFLTYIWALELKLPITTTILIINTYPIFIFIYSYFFLNEKIKQKIFFLFLSIIGLLMILYEDGIFFQENFLAISLSLLNAISYSSYFILVRNKSLNDGMIGLTDTIYTMFFAITFTIITIIIVLLYDHTILNLYHIIDLNTTIILSLLGLGIISTAIPYLLLNIGLSYESVSTSSIKLLIEIAVVLFIGIFIFNESVSILKIVGGILIILSAILA